jgi:hypothetical protein
MAQVNIGAAIGAGFGLMRRHPLSVLAWGALPIALQVGAFVLFAPLFVAIYAPYVAAAQAHTIPTAPPTMTPQMLQADTWLQLFNLVQVLVTAVVNCAVFRAVLHPERSAFAFLRLGLTDLLVFVLIFMAVIVMAVVMVIVMIPVGVVMGFMMVMAHGSTTALLVAAPLVVLAVLMGMLAFALRFALAPAMVVDDGKFHLFDAWVLTRGHFWTMFAVAISLVLIAIVAELVFLVFAVAAGGAGLVAIAGSLANLQSLFALPPPTLLARIAPVLAVYLLVAIPFFGALFAFLAAPWAQILRDLKPGAAEVFG